MFFRYSGAHATTCDDLIAVFSDNFLRHETFVLYIDSVMQLRKAMDALDVWDVPRRGFYLLCAGERITGDKALF